MMTQQDFLYTSSRGHEMALSLYGRELEDNAPCVVYLHGFKGFKDWGFVPHMAAELVSCGIRVLAMNFSHNGIGPDPLEFTELEKFKANTFSLELEEALEIIQKYKRGKLFGARPGSRMGLLGHSRGGGIALLAGQQAEEISAVCTWAAVSTFARYPQEVIDRWREQGSLEVRNARTGQVLELGWNLHADLLEHADGKLNIQRAVRGIDKPLCILHGEADEAVEVDDAHAIFDWADNARVELHLIPEAGHTFGARHPWAGSNPMLDDVLQHTCTFFEGHLK